jgi:hypothetical protein
VSAAGVKRQLLVLTEGQATEPGYIVHWSRRFRQTVTVQIDARGAGPLQLVRGGVEAKRGDERDARRGKGRPFDEVWCIFDVDEHAELVTALDLARRHGIRVAVSNPCIELWFILHFESQTAYIERGAAQKRSSTLLGCKKTLTNVALRTLDEKLADARNRAQQLDAKHQGDGSPPGSNPSSSVWKLVDSIASD